ncbi:hypothetical protein OE766_24160 [Pararhizobium sp. YC-54]|uniref:hypothetical protein n=1 Tax=Pararhizobium sp. YC-54 TaxID=2986920 RepID=UPI0021F79547|nr:hypothetical protein [Pararhizobium sp. YC-54]MCW0001321.1 hypothetical protein [Pararhizobium sp. YC-54]
MPILTVKTPVAAAQAAVLVEAVTPRERTLPVSMPGRISGNQSEAVLKILETLNRHLLESEPLPKDALIRLLDTLAKILKFPPLPQETLRDFSKRLAVFLETLPPAARLALEKQLGQHNLAISIRILTEALRMPSIIDMPRLLDRPWVPLTAPRAGTAQPDSKPLQTQTPPQGQTPVPGRQTPVSAAQTIMAGPAVIPDPGLLQAALKKAFSDDETGPAVIAFEESLDNESPAATLRADQPAKAQTARGSGSALASGQPPQPSRANAESIPLLRAAAAFLAADPEALSLVAAIAAGDMDAGLKAKLAEELGLDLSEPMETPEQPEHSAGTNRPGSGIEDDAFRTSEGEPDGPANTGTSSARPTATRDLQDVDGFKGHDLGEWELEIVPENQSLAGTNETPSPLAEAEMGHPEKSLAQTLKALVEASLPLPGSVPDGSDTLFAALAGETADIGAEILFAQLEAADTAEMPPDTSLLTGDTGDRMEMAGFEHDSWSAMLDGPEEKPGNRPTPMHPATMEESAREALTPRLPDAGIARDAIPFAMIPYLPAKTQETRATEIEEEEEEEQAAFSGEDNEDEGQNREERGEQEDHTTAVPRTDLEDEESQAADAYDLYRRMGGYG